MKSLSFDILESLRAELQETLSYPGWSPFDASVQAVEHALPPGSVAKRYAVGSTFLVRNGSGLVGKVYYVVGHDDYRPNVLLLSEQVPAPLKSPAVTVVANNFASEITGKWVNVGLRETPNAQQHVVVPMSEDTRPTSRDGRFTFNANPFRSGSLTIHCAALERWENTFVFGLLNQPRRLVTRMYSLGLRLEPESMGADNIEVNRWFHSVVNMNYTVALTKDSPFMGVIPELPPQMVWDEGGPMSGFDVILENYGQNKTAPDFPPRTPAGRKYAEHVGRYDVKGTGHDLED